MLQQIIRSLAKSIFGQVTETNAELRNAINAVDTKASELKSHVGTQVWSDILDKERRIVANTLQLQALEIALGASNASTTQLIHDKINNVDAKINSFAGLVDDSNLDSIREIANRIKSESQGAQSLRAETQSAYQSLNEKVEAMLPHKTLAEWDDIIRSRSQLKVNWFFTQVTLNIS